MSRKGKHRKIPALALLLAGFSLGVAGHGVPAWAFTVSGVSFSDFHKSADTCYRCDRDDDAEPARPDPREVARQDLIKQADYAWSNNDRATALQYAQQALMIRDSAELREWVRKVQALLLVDRAAALADSGDHHGALGLYHQALAMWPDVLADKEQFNRYEAAVARRDQAEAEQRAEAQRHAAMLQGWRDADAAALEDMKQGKWREADARYEKARMDSLGIADNAGGDPSEVPNTIYSNRAVAAAGLARSQGNIDGAIRNLQSALTWNPANETANALLKLAYEERERSASAMQATLQKLQPIIDDGAVYAGGPKDLAVLNASIPEIARSPEAERARKGLVAAANHDWKVALAWYQDALNRDPGNPALKRAVDLAQWMVKARPVSGPILQAPKQTGTTPADDGSDGEAKIMAEVYRELADGFAKTQFTDPRDKAKAAYFANEYRKQAVEAQMFADSVQRARERQSLPFK